MVCETGYRLETYVGLIVWLEQCRGLPEKQAPRKTTNSLILKSENI
jgi:hypothetical protein